jgi:hypothetical protein
LRAWCVPLLSALASGGADSQCPLKRILYEAWILRVPQNQNGFYHAVSENLGVRIPILEAILVHGGRL